MDRAQLLAETAVDINRRDKDHLLPTWLRSAEFRLNNLLRHREMVTRAILQVTERVFPTPPDFLEVESMSIQDGTADNTVSGKRGSLFYAPADQVDQNPSQFLTDGPHWFTTRGKHFELVGWRYAGPFQIQLYYYAKLPVLDIDTRTNWLLDEAPHLYKNAIKHFAYDHLEEYDKSMSYLQSVAAECTAMNENSQSMKYGAGPLIKRAAPRLGGRHS